MSVMKNELRKNIKDLRRNMPSEEVLIKSKKASEFLIKSDIFKNSDCIMLYKALGNETDTETIIREAIAKGKKVALPVTDAKNGRITPFMADADTSFEKGGFSVMEPQNTAVVQNGEIDVVVVPGIAFDLQGNRIGFGKGCYDMFLEKCSAVKIGLCYDFQVVDEIPTEAFDIKMDYILTEKGLFRCVI